MNSNKNIIDPLNLSTTIVIIPNHDKTQIIGKATGFFYRKNNKVFLLTNYHVVSGRNPKNNKCMRKSGYCDFAEISIFLMTKKLGIWERVRIQLVSDESKTCYQYISDRDVAAIDISLTADVEKYSLVCVNDYETENAVFEVGERVTILGNPHGFSQHGIFPIWKTGFIASEPNIEEDNSYLVDAKTFGGMSGSPVFYMRRKEGFNTKNSVYMCANHTEFVGIYSDRPMTKEFDTGKFIEMGLGTIWKRRCVDDLVNQPS